MPSASLQMKAPLQSAPPQQPQHLQQR
jgi:hypothetical protein